MHQRLNEYKLHFDKVMDFLNDEMRGVRTGRAHPGLVEGVRVMVYGTETPIKQVATVTVPDARTLQIEPWDQGVVKDIERALTLADLGSTPNVNGKIIRLAMPALNEESRKKMMKLVKEKLEDARVKLRQIREDARHVIQKLEKDHEIAEDEKFKVLDELDKMTRDFIGKVDEVGVGKEDEIMTV